jgi:hypothetical protein
MRRKIDLIILFIVLVAAGFAVPNARNIDDFWHSKIYHPPADVVQLANDAGMNAKGKQLFYRFSPEIVDQATLNQKCTAEKLGCTTGVHIYILQANTPTDYDRNIVTAAHEMLHVAYSRLSASQRDNLQPLLQNALNDPNAQDVDQILTTYSPSSYYNEAHSFIGSELAVKSAALNSYYSQYFSDRNKTIDAFSKSSNDQY